MAHFDPAIELKPLSQLTNAPARASDVVFFS